MARVLLDGNADQHGGIDKAVDPEPDGAGLTVSLGGGLAVALGGPVDADGALHAVNAGHAGRGLQFGERLEPVGQIVAGGKLHGAERCCDGQRSENSK